MKKAWETFNPPQFTRKVHNIYLEYGVFTKVNEPGKLLSLVASVNGTEELASRVLDGRLLPFSQRWFLDNEIDTIYLGVTADDLHATEVWLEMRQEAAALGYEVSQAVTEQKTNIQHDQKQCTATTTCEGAVMFLSHFKIPDYNYVVDQLLHTTTTRQGRLLRS